MQDWMISFNGQQSGPFDDATLRAMLASGQIPSQAFVWKAGMSDWVPAASVFPPAAPSVPAGMPAPPQPRGSAVPLGIASTQAYVQPYGQPAANQNFAAAGASTKSKSRALGIVLAIIMPGLQRVYYGDNAALGMLQFFVAFLFYFLGMFECFAAVVAVGITAWAVYEAVTLPID